MADMIPEGTKVQVSATAPGTTRRALLRDDDDAWTAPAVPATLTLSFPSPVSFSRVGLTFQGGFVATTINVVATRENEGDAVEVPLGKIFPEDVSRRQVLGLGPTEGATALRLEFAASSDHHGRVTLYRVELLA